MNDNFNQKKIRFIINFAYIFAIILTIYIFFKYLLGICIPFLLAILLCYIAEPTVNTLSTKLKINRSICSAVCITVIVLLGICIIFIISVVICSQARSLFSFIPNIISNISDYFDALDNKTKTSFYEKALLAVKEYIISFDVESITSSGMADKAISYFTNIFKSLPRLLTTIIVTFAFSLFFSSSFPQVKAFIKNRFSLKNRIMLHNIKVSSVNILKNYVKSYSILMMITFFELSLAFMLFDIQPAIALALLISLIDILPVFGVGTVMIPWGIICLLTSDFSMAAIILSVYAVITVIRQIIEPKIISKNIGLPPIVTLPVMFLGLTFFGITGLFAAPIISTVIYDLYQKGYIKLWK